MITNNVKNERIEIMALVVSIMSVTFTYLAEIEWLTFVCLLAAFGILLFLPISSTSGISDDSRELRELYIIMCTSAYVLIFAACTLRENLTPMLSLFAVAILGVSVFWRAIGSSFRKSPCFLDVIATVAVIILCIAGYYEAAAVVCILAQAVFLFVGPSKLPVGNQYLVRSGN